MLFKKKDKSADAANVSHPPTLIGSDNEQDRLSNSGKDNKDDAVHVSENAEDSAPSVDAKNQIQEHSPASDTHVHGIKFALVMLALVLAIFIYSLDNSIISTAIPKITDEFNSLEDVGWYGSAYFLTTAGLQLFFGKLYRYFNIKWVFIGAITMFEIGSLICGAAPTSVALIVGRAIAGMGAAGFFSGTMIILAYSMPLEERPLWTGMLGGVYGIASVIGPLLGGVFTDKATWRWCFYINLPIGAITVLVIIFLFPDPKNGIPFQSDNLWDKIMEFDPIGTFFFLPAIICLLLALHWGGHEYEWSDGRIIALLVLFGVLLLAFIAAQFWAGDSATVPIRIIKDRTVASSFFYMGMMASASFVLVYYIPIWFQSVKGKSAIMSGVMNLPMVVGMVIGTISAGALVSKFGHFVPFMIIGTILLSIGTGLLTLFEVSSGANFWIGFQFLSGLGMGTSFQQPLVAVQACLPMSDVSTGTSLIAFSQTLTAAVFLAVAQTIFTKSLNTGIRDFAPNIAPEEVLQHGATAIRDVFSGDDLFHIRQAYNSAITDTFKLAVGLSCASIIAVFTVRWINVLKKSQDEASTEEKTSSTPEAAV